ncbi:tannase/feruloyl esterase family alpha/beta hydrolase [Marinobacter salarius]|uniref:tannase/feruloyl esterase family alpha/beta hydrolase n=1 Tax=Marinobacter salarius TaxID=1420917 RepID=UPI003D0AF7FD
MNYRFPTQKWHAAVLISGTILLTACNDNDGSAAFAPTPSTPSEAQLRAACPELSGMKIPASQIGLESGEATITDSTLVPAVDGPPTLPEYCQVLGSIAPVDQAAPPITYQINLPLDWNEKSVQYGGGGFNGSLVTGLDQLRNIPEGTPLPITQGYVTFGTDSGHRTADASAPTEVAEFALNNEAFENFAFASYKKVKDVAFAVVNQFYERAPSYSYYYGGSEGGREGLTMAQRFPTDYDGIVSVVPVIRWTGLFHGFQRNASALFDGGWMNDAEVETLGKGVVAACDQLDGLADGVIHDFLACQTQFNPQVLQCANDAEAAASDDCLSIAQIDLIEAVGSRYNFTFPLANGLMSYPEWLHGVEDVSRGFARWITGPQPPTQPVDSNPGNSSRQHLYGDNFIRYVITQDPNFDLRNYDVNNYGARIQEVSQLMDSTDPDLSAFFKQGGKLIIREDTGDYAQSPLTGMEYFESMEQRLGTEIVASSARLYLATATTHSGNGESMTDGRVIPTNHDMLATLDQWVTENDTPADVLTLILNESEQPHATLATQKMCRYPNYPHYTGGDELNASSYECRPSVY